MSRVDLGLWSAVDRRGYISPSVLKLMVFHIEISSSPSVISYNVILGKVSDVASGSERQARHQQTISFRNSTRKCWNCMAGKLI